MHALDRNVVVTKSMQFQLLDTKMVYLDYIYIYRHYCIHLKMILCLQRKRLKLFRVTNVVQSGTLMIQEEIYTWLCKSVTTFGVGQHQTRMSV